MAALIVAAGRAGRDHRALRRRRRRASTAFPLAKWLPYAVTRTWHTQLGIFWIATAWLATGLFVAPAVGGHEPKYQRLGVNFLFVCLLVIVVGSMAGEWLGVQQKLGGDARFWFGHQGYEYVDLGRFWQIFLFVGLFVWLGLMVARHAGRRSGSQDEQPAAARPVRCSRRSPSPLFYGAGPDVRPAQPTSPSAEYWRWWVVHLWVEGFFEVFATVVIAFLFTRLGLLRRSTATRRGAVLHDHLPRRAASSAPSTTSTSPARRRRCWRWARSSARWRSCRWC